MATEKENPINPNRAVAPNSKEFEEIEIPYEGITDRNTGLGEMLENAEEGITISSDVSGDDIEVNHYQAEVEGDEAVGGTTPTPDQNVTEYIEKSVGLEMDDRAFLRTNDILEQRDDQRWELDPTSSEDYQERRE
jgi:Family of unknown function (DUF6335)